MGLAHLFAQVGHRVDRLHLGIPTSHQPGTRHNQPQPESTLNKCPHCQFLVREDMRTCEVCHKPLEGPRSVPAFAAGQRSDDALAARIGPTEAGFPAAVLWLFVVGTLLAAAVVITTLNWS